MMQSIRKSILGWSLLACLAGVGCGQGDKQGESKKETASAEKTSMKAIPYEGMWKAAAATVAGNAFPSAVTDTISLQLAAANYEVSVGGKLDKGTCTLDRSVTPWRMTIKGTEGPNAGKTMLAIFELPKEEELRICYDLKGTAFPTAFESTRENGWFLAVYKRAK